MRVVSVLRTIILCVVLNVVTTCIWHDEPPELVDLETHIDSDRCGYSEFVARRTRMLHGKNADISEFPWIVLLRFFKHHAGSPDKREGCRCTGFLITSKYILTAAHCVHGIINGTQINVTVGSNDVEDFPNHEAFHFHEHESYTSDPRINDIAMVKLHLAVTFNETIAPICIRPKRTDFLNETLVISGFGETGTLMPNQLQKGLAKVIDFDYELILTTSGDGESQACEGDSGGPLMYRENGKFYAIGVFNRFGPGDCNTSIHGVYTPISEYQDWIVKTIQNLQQEN